MRSAFSYRSLRWEQTRRAAIEAAGFHCVIPGCPTRWDLHAHHVIPLRLCKDPYDLRNIEVRCRIHHAAIHGLRFVPKHWREMPAANDAQLELDLAVEPP